MAENGQLAEEYHPQQTPSPTLSPPNSPAHNSGCQINRRLLPIKGYYFFFLAAVGDLLPFIGIYMLHLGLTPQETGIIYGVMPFIGFFVRPLVGAVSDKYKKHKLVLMLVTAFSGIFYFLLVFVPSRHQQTLSVRTNFACNNQDSYFKDCKDASHPASCDYTLTQFANSSMFQEFNSSLECSVSCSASSSDSSPPEFQACFTNGTGAYGEDNACDSSVFSTLTFTVPDLKKLIAEEITSDRDEMGPYMCLYYDVKDIFHDQHLKVKSLQILCEKELLLDCTIHCKELNSCSADRSSIYLDTTFFVFFVIFLMANVAFAPIFPILDAAAYDILGDDGLLWGKQRLWGTLGFAIFAVTSTFIMQFREELKLAGNYSVQFYLFLPLTVAAAVISMSIKMSSEIKCSQFLKNIWKLLSYLEVSAFLFVVMYFGMLTGALEAFLFWYLTMIGSSPLVFGFILLVNCCAEVPMLWIAGTIIKKIGLVNCLYLALVCYGIRLGYYSFLSDPRLVLIVEPLYGVCFALMYAAASSYASIIAPPGMSATVQGLLGGVHFGFGKGVGSLLTGFMFEILGPEWTWRTYSIISFLLLLAYICLNVFVFSKSNRPPSVRVDTLVTAHTELPDERSNQDENLINSQHNHQRAVVI